MENNRTSDVFAVVEGIGVPSGLEVESARLHLPSEVTRGSGWRQKLGTVRTAGKSRIKSVRGGVTRSVSSTQNHLRTHPGLWASAAAGAGFTLGIIGRLMLYRKQRSMPDVIVISAAC